MKYKDLTRSETPLNWKAMLERVALTPERFDRFIMTYIIETGIPIPDKGGGKSKSELRQILEQLEIGQSVLLESPKEKRLHIQSFPGYKFTIRKVDEDHIRVWRIKAEDEED